MPTGIYKHNKLSEKTKNKISNSHIGMKYPYIPHPNAKGKVAWNKGKNWSDEIKNKISKNRKGKNVGQNHHNWKGGISFEPYSVNWTETLKRAIRERDNYICQICNQYGYYVHHIDYNKKNCDPDNLITLCSHCHTKTNFNRKFYSYQLKQRIEGI